MSYFYYFIVKGLSILYGRWLCTIQINFHHRSEQSKIKTGALKKGFMSRNKNTRTLTICLVSVRRLLVCLLVVLPPRFDVINIISLFSCHGSQQLEVHPIKEAWSIPCYVRSNYMWYYVFVHDRFHRWLWVISYISDILRFEITFH